MRVAAVIPCHNEGKHIGNVVGGALKFVDEVVVCDNWSTDNTMEIALRAGATVLPAIYKQMGYGVSVQAGINHVKLYRKADIIVLLDGDGQHDPEDMPSMLKPIFDDKADIVMGDRLDGEGVPGYRRFGNKVLSMMCNIGADYKPQDAMTGYWALKIGSVPVLTERTWGLAVELLVKARANGCRLVSVPVRAVYNDTYADNSTTSPFSLGINLLWYILKWRLRVEHSK